MALLDAQGKAINGQAPIAPPSDPTKEISRVIRLIETARRLGQAELCAQLEACHAAGWALTIDEKIPTTKSEVTILMHLSRDVNGLLQNRGERWVRLGKEYEAALMLVVAEKDKEKTPEQKNMVQSAVNDLKDESKTYDS